MHIGPDLELEGWLGTGAMGTVYSGRWTVRGASRDVAIKLERGGEAVLRDARALLGLDHPNIVAVLDCGWTTAPWDEYPEGTAYVVMQRVHGENLTEWAGRGEAVAIAAVRAVLAGLAHAHHRGVLHGDISPGNVLTWSDEFWLTDFGGAGTEGFKAPERAAGPTVASDLYSVGALGRFLGSEDPRLAGLLSEDPADRPGSAAQALVLLSGARQSSSDHTT